MTDTNIALDIAPDVVDVIAAAICHTAHGMADGSWCANCRSKADHIWAPVLLEALAVHVAAERDRDVREALAPVWALADEWEVDGGAEPFAWRRLRAALPDNREGESA